MKKIDELNEIIIEKYSIFAYIADELDLGEDYQLSGDAEIMRAKQIIFNEIMILQSELFTLA